MMVKRIILGILFGFLFFSCSYQGEKKGKSEKIVYIIDTAIYYPNYLMADSFDVRKMRDFSMIVERVDSVGYIMLCIPSDTIKMRVVEKVNVQKVDEGRRFVIEYNVANMDDSTDKARVGFMYNMSDGKATSSRVIIGTSTFIYMFEDNGKFIKQD